MVLNMIGNLSVVVLAVTHMVFKTTSGFASYGSECWWLAWCLTGVPLIFMAYHGVSYRNESFVRIYLYYMWIFMIIIIYLTLKNLVFTPACENLPAFLTTASSAWACGMARWIHVLVTLTSLSILGYFSHVVYSYCEDLAELGGGPELGDLMLNQKAMMARRLKAHGYASLEGMQIMKEQGWMFEKLIAGHQENSLNGMEGSVPLFGRSYHDTSFPPNSTSKSTQEEGFVSNSEQQASV